MTGRIGLRGRHLAFAVCFGFLLWANLETPLWADDYCRTVSGGFAQYLSAAWHDYFTWTGRFFVSLITYFFLSVAPPASLVLFACLNALVFVGLVAVVLRLARAVAGTGEVRSRNTLTDFVDAALVAMLLWWLPRTIGEVALWKTGSIGYLWPITGALLLVAHMLPGARPVRLWLVPFAFIIATFLEPLSALMCGVLAVLAVRRWRDGARLPAAVALAHLAGTIFLLVAPGNFQRAAVVAPDTAMDRILGVVATFGSLFDAYWIPAAIVIALPFVWPGGPRVAVRTVLAAGWGWMFLVLALAYLLVLLALPRALLASRVAFPASVFFVCYLAALWQLRPVSSAHDRRTAWLLAGLAVAHCVVVVPDLRALALIDRQWRDALGPQAGTDAVLPLVRVSGRIVLIRKYRFFVGLNPSPSYVVNVCYARVMGVKSVTALTLPPSS